MTITKPFQLGSISTGTLKTEDLLVPFADSLEEISGDNDKAEETVTNARLAFGDKLARYYDARSRAKLLEELIAQMNEFCPPFVYFGTHPDDGADFGFWPDWDALADCKELQFGHITAWTDEYQCMVTREDDNVTVIDLNRNILWTTA